MFCGFVFDSLRRHGTIIRAISELNLYQKSAKSLSKYRVQNSQIIRTHYQISRAAPEPLTPRVCMNNKTLDLLAEGFVGL